MATVGIDGKQLKGACGDCGRKGIWRDASGGRAGTREDPKEEKEESEAHG